MVVVNIIIDIFILCNSRNSNIIMVKRRKSRFLFRFFNKLSYCSLFIIFLRFDLYDVYSYNYIVNVVLKFDFFLRILYDKYFFLYMNY